MKKITPTALKAFLKLSRTAKIYYLDKGPKDKVRATQMLSKPGNVIIITQEEIDI